MEYWSPEPIWNNQRVFLLGGGPSLAGFDFAQLRGCHVLAVNEAFRDAPWADLLFFRDHDWFQRVRSGLDIWRGHIVTVSPGAAADWPERVRLLPPKGPLMPRARTSGQQAVGLALMMRAREIVLLGYDWNPDGGNYHDRHTAPGLKYKGGLTQGWTGYRERAAGCGATIINATPGSRINEFRRAPLSDLL